MTALHDEEHYKNGMYQCGMGTEGYLFPVCARSG